MDLTKLSNIIKPRLTRWLVVLLLMFSQPGMADMFVEKLLAADQIKASDFVSFQQKLREFEPEKNKMSSFELSYLQLLHAYEASYTRQTQQALTLLTSLTEAEVDQTISFRAKALLINSLLISRRYLDAFNYLEHLLVQLPDIKQPMAREQALSVIAMMYTYVDLFEQAIEYTVILESEALRPTAVCWAKQLKLDAMLRAGKYAEFKSEYATALQACILSKDKLWANLIRLHMANLLLLEKQPQAALDLLKQFYHEAESTRYPVLTQEFDATLAQAYFALGDQAKAKNHALLVAEQDDVGASSMAKVRALQLLSDLNKAEQNYQQALQYHELYMAAFTAYMDEKSAQQLAYHKAHSEILQQTQQIALLDRDNQLLQYQQKSLQQQARFNQLLILALVLLIFGLAFSAYRSFIARQRFQILAENDDLTAISNRYHFILSAKSALALCEKNQLPAALIVFDLDNFKQINDLYGHAAGDWALRQTVEACRNFMRNNDLFGRIGGEEFAILLPGCQSDKALLLADVCRDAISQIDTLSFGQEFKLSASFGVTSAQMSGYHLTKLIEDADRAMYQAKQAGRNKVQFFNG